MSDCSSQDDTESHITETIRAITASTPTETPPELASSIAREYITVSTTSYYSYETIAASCYYCAAKIDNQPLHPADITSVSIVTADENTILDLAQDIATTLDIAPLNFMNSTPYVSRYCTHLELPDAVCQRATEIVMSLSDSAQSSGHSPTGWAASAVYTAAAETGDTSVTQREIADIAHVSPVTVRKGHYLQEELLNEREGS